ncbi:MAG: polysaccharide deacetylase family protein [bacterium]|nr:MAG: polysaccharide deacetylase family protein [bacterium]
MGYKAKGKDNSTETSIQYRVSSNQKSASSIQHPASQPEALNNELSANSHELAGDSKPKATFFVLGWLAERLPHLVREIHARGHEVASHGYHHILCNQMSSEKLKNDLIDSKKVLEDIIGSPVYGYRAPSFAINNDILKLIADTGYLYDSSYNSFSLHGRYGKLDLSCNGNYDAAIKISDKLYELPISNLKIANQIVPLGGGGYFRLLPTFLFRKGIKSILNNANTYLFYLHPWEIDPEQPKVDEVSINYKLRHYSNLRKTHKKLNKLFKNFRECRFITCRQYLEQINF